MHKTLLALSLMFGVAAYAQQAVIVVPQLSEVPEGYCSPDWPKLPEGEKRHCSAKQPPKVTDVPKPAPKTPPVRRPKELITV